MTFTYVFPSTSSHGYKCMCIYVSVYVYMVKYKLGPILSHFDSNPRLLCSVVPVF